MTYQCWDIAETDAFDDEVLFAGYRAGAAGDPEPSWPGNSSQAYVHGWHTGAADAGRIPIPDWMRVLAAMFIKRQKEKKHGSVS